MSVMRLVESDASNFISLLRDRADSFAISRASFWRCDFHHPPEASMARPSTMTSAVATRANMISDCPGAELLPRRFIYATSQRRSTVRICFTERR